MHGCRKKQNTLCVLTSPSTFLNSLTYFHFWGWKYPFLWRHAHTCSDIFMELYFVLFCNSGMMPGINIVLAEHAWTASLGYVNACVNTADVNWTWHIYASFRCTAQVEVLSAALRASSLDPQEETAAGIGKSVDCQKELSLKDKLKCKFIQDDTVPLINDAVEVNTWLLWVNYFKMFWLTNPYSRREIALRVVRKNMRSRMK